MSVLDKMGEYPGYILKQDADWREAGCDLESILVGERTGGNSNGKDTF